MNNLCHKISIATLLICIYAENFFAQDTMVTKTGEIKTVYNVEISQEAVFYKNSNTDNAQIERISETELFMIKRPDGTMYNLDNTEYPKQTTDPPLISTTPQTQQTSSNNTISEEAENHNRELIEKLNNATPTITGKVGKSTSRVYCIFGVTENSCLANDQLELSITIDSWFGFCNGHEIYLNIKNKTNKMIYIDLGNTFFISGDVATPYYIPMSSSTSTTTGSGMSVNAGAVAGAFGMGVSIGQLASGINVGGGRSSTTVNVVYSQRVIAIPPLSSKKLDQQRLFADDGNYNNLTIHDWNSKKDIAKILVDHEYVVGESYAINQENSPANFAFQITYSTTEDCLETQSMRVDLYTRNIIGYTHKT